MGCASLLQTACAEDFVVRESLQKIGVKKGLAAGEAALSQDGANRQ